MKAWCFQDFKAKQKLGDAAPWSVGWLDPEGKRRSKKIGAKSRAEKFARKIEGQLEAGLYQRVTRVTWSSFRQEYEAKILPRLKPETRRITATAMDHFERLVKPVKLDSIKTQSIDQYVSRRQTEAGKKPGSTVSPATVNRELRHLKAALRVANDWGYLPVVPKIRKLKEEKRMGAIVTPEHFDLIYAACNKATLPKALPGHQELHYDPVDWWRALISFAVCTGWRIEEILSLRKDDLDTRTGRVVTMASDNKAGVDAECFLPPGVLELVTTIVSFNPLVFVWPYDIGRLYDEFHAIQEAAGIDLPCRDEGKHECTDCCHRYGFHALRRSYASQNVSRLSVAELGAAMRHASVTTTLKHYVGLQSRMKDVSERIYVPDCIPKPTMSAV